MTLLGYVKERAWFNREPPKFIVHDDWCAEYRPEFEIHDCHSYSFSNHSCHGHNMKKPFQNSAIPRRCSSLLQSLCSRLLDAPKAHLTTSLIERNQSSIESADDDDDDLSVSSCRWERKKKSLWQIYQSMFPTNNNKVNYNAYWFGSVRIKRLKVSKGVGSIERKEADGTASIPCQWYTSKAQPLWQLRDWHRM